MAPELRTLDRQGFRGRVLERLGRVSPGLRRVVENIGWLMVDRIVRMGMGLFVGVWVARYLGPAQFGSLNFAQAFVALFGTVTTLGLDLIVVQELLHHGEHTHEILGTTLALRSAAGLVGMAVAVAVLRLMQPHDQQALLLVSILSLTLLFQAFDAIDSLFQSQVRSKITVWAKNSAFLLFAAVRVALIHARAPVWTFAVAITAEIVLGAIGLTIGLRLTGGRLSLWRVSRSRALGLLKQSWPVIFSSMAIMVYMRLDMVMLKLMQGDGAVGIYSAATRVSEVWYFIPMTIVSSVSPALLRVKDDAVLFASRLRKLFALMTLTAVGIGSVVALLSHVVIHTLYANGYAGAAPVLAVHVWASVFVFLGVAQTPWDLAQNLLRLSLYRTIAGAVINVLLNLYLIPHYAAMGAAIATVVSYAVSGVFANLFHARTRPVFWMQMRSFVPQRFW